MDRKSHNNVAKPDKQACELTRQLNLLEAVDRRITLKHVARRFRELLDDAGDDALPAPLSAATGNCVTANPSGTAPERPATAAHSTGPAEMGYRGPTACAAAGITYRQLDYWARTGLVEPSVRQAHGSGSQRLYSFCDILLLKVVKRLLDLGISLQQIRTAVQDLRDHGNDDLAQVTLMSDGVSIYECTWADEVVDLLQGGQGVFGIALGRVWREVNGSLAVRPTARAEDGFMADVDLRTPRDPSSPNQDNLASAACVVVPEPRVSGSHRRTL